MLKTVTVSLLFLPEKQTRPYSPSKALLSRPNHQLPHHHLAARRQTTPYDMGVGDKPFPPPHLAVSVPNRLHTHHSRSSV